MSPCSADVRHQEALKCRWKLPPSSLCGESFLTDLGCVHRTHHVTSKDVRGTGGGVPVSGEPATPGPMRGPCLPQRHPARILAGRENRVTQAAPPPRLLQGTALGPQPQVPSRAQQQPEQPCFSARGDSASGCVCCCDTHVTSAGGWPPQSARICQVVEQTLSPSERSPIWDPVNQKPWGVCGEQRMPESARTVSETV